MDKKQIIKELRKINPLRSISSFNLETKESLQTIYDEGIKIGFFKKVK